MMDTLDITIPIQPKYNFKKNSILYKVSFKEMQIILVLPNKRKLINMLPNSFHLYTLI